MAFFVDAGLLLMTLLFGALGIWTLSVREKANGEMMSRHLAIQWQEMKTPLPAPTYGLSFVFLIISLICMLGFVIAVSITR